MLHATINDKIKIYLNIVVKTCMIINQFVFNSAFVIILIYGELLSQKAKRLSLIFL